MMIVAAARELAGQRVCFVGVGLPNIAVNLAKRTVAPDLELVYEAGVFGARPARLPLSIGDPTIVTGATAVTSMFELFSFYLQGGLIDVGFLGAAQIDRFGNINTTVIGDYDAPDDAAARAAAAPARSRSTPAQVFVIMRQSKRSLRRADRLPDVARATSAARSSPSGSGASRAGSGRGPSVVVTDLAHLALRRDRRDARRLAPPGRDARRGPRDVGWEPKVAPTLADDAGADRR